MSWDDGEYYDTACGIGRSRRYHSHMRDFYRRIADLITVISAISGTSAFVTLFLTDRTTILAQILTGIIAASSLLNLIYGFGKKADQHDKLTKDFIRLAAEIESLPATFKNLSSIKSKRLLIEVDEPHVRRVIDLRAQNEEWRSRGVSHDRLLPLGFWQERSPLAYFFDFGLASLQKRRDQQNTKYECLKSE